MDFFQLVGYFYAPSTLLRQAGVLPTTTDTAHSGLDLGVNVAVWGLAAYLIYKAVK